MTRPRFRELSEDDDIAALQLEVGRRCRVQFDWTDWPGRDDKLHVPRSSAGTRRAEF